ncbi:hypothetical protein [Nocardiopsis sp. HUAS JQ3]|uniref:hypothetical protein n=1 Tax=Nocardiopsis sp. HUAS JQ3 TaxID=3061629 RepID=UPI0023A95A62|nr:hypothetical protein [Nocardiopsis sp. HUAS JQ3]WDZ90325.1 hypothetical protein PV789_26085 [Nocardiopsis sp. HUAS JQ3]
MPGRDTVWKRGARERRPVGAEARCLMRAGGLLLVAVGTAFLQMGGREEGERAAAGPTPGPGE